MKTLIYRVKSSGNQAKLGSRETAQLSKEQYLKISKIVNKDIYVDDCLSGEKSEKEVIKRAYQLENVLNGGGFKVKGVSFSNYVPFEN